MFFKLKTGIPEIIIVPHQNICIENVGQDKNITVSIKHRESSEIENPYSPIFTICEAIADINLPLKAMTDAEAIFNDKFPEEFDLSDIPEDLRHSYENTGKNTHYIISKSQLSESLRVVLDDTFKYIHSSILYILGLASWQGGINVPIYVTYIQPMEWSEDGKNWRMAPVDFEFDTDEIDCFVKSQEPKIQSFVQQSKREPLAQELFREAWNQRNTNLRSSLVIGITALESSVKDLISKLIPEAEWLIKSIPSPPIPKILDEYFPKLSVKTGIIKDEIHLPKDMLESFKKWNLIRNEIVHGKNVEINYEKLIDFLNLIKDFIYLCDYIRGEDWALENIRSESKEKLFSNKEI